jgi:hypothetical protein
LRLPQDLTKKILDVHKAGKVFSTVVEKFEPGQPFSLRTVIGNEKWTECYMEAYKEGDQMCVGDLLGYPECCRKAFIKHWQEEGDLDWTWKMVGVRTGMHRVVADSYFQLVPFYNRYGVRAIQHMPCSVRCKPSHELAKEYLALWPEEERRWYYEIMGWAAEWSSLHGVAEVRTPVCKIIHSTTYYPDERIVQLEGMSVPRAAATGNRFPYTGKAELYSGNGFWSEEAMTKAHRLILAAAKDARDVKSICDPGCGNGVLLQKLGTLLGVGSSMHGIDYNPHAVAQGRGRFALNIIEGNIFDYYSSADMVVFMPGRLLEHPDRAERFVKGLNFRYLLLYGYSAYAHEVCKLKNQHWPELKVINEYVDDCGLATLLERSV